LGDGGTVFFDEIGDMPLPIQAKILRVIEEKSFERVGGRRTINADIRIIAATNKVLERMIEEERFREDLFYRLNVFPITILPLRERLEDIPLLVKHFIQKYNAIVKTHIKGISPPALKKLKRYPWPGNVRELENIIERAFILSGSKPLKKEHFPILFEKVSVFNPQINGKSLKDISRTAKNIAEKKAIEEALIKTKWNRVKAAKLLNVDYKTLRIKMKELNIEPK